MILLLKQDVRGDHTVQRTFKKEGRINQPHAVVFGTVDPKKGTPIDGIAIIPIWPMGMRGTNSDKDSFTGFVEGIALRARAIGVLMVMEIWLLQVEKAEDPARFEQLRSGNRPRNLEHEPGRTEAVVLSLEHLAFESGTHFWIADIERKAGAAGILGEFKYVKPERATGRFINLFHREGFA